MNLALTVLLTGGIVVFFVLILLIFFIKGYSTIVHKLESKVKVQKTEEKNDNKEISDEVVAAISAAVISLYSENKTTYKRKNLKRRRTIKSNWANVGLIEELSSF